MGLFASVQTAFAEGGAEAPENTGEIVEGNAADAVQGDTGDGNVETNSEAVHADGELEVEPKVVSYESFAAMVAQNPDDWQVVQDHFGARVGTSIGLGFLYSGALAGISLVFLSNMEEKCYREDNPQSCRDRNSKKTVGYFIFNALGAALAPSLAVHTSHRIWGGDGSLGWTYLGGLIGGGVGFLGGVAAWVWGDSLLGAIVIPTVGIVFGMVGAIVAYEVTNSDNREEKYGTISRIYPVIELGERNILGVGIEF